MVKRLMFLINSIVAVTLLILYALSFVPPSQVPFLPAITLITPVVLVVNILFFFYWLLGLSKKSLLSLITTLICFPFFLNFFQFGFGKKQHKETEKVVKVFNYNTYGFLGVETRKSFRAELLKLITEESPDILFLQECSLINFKNKLAEYKYRIGVTKYVGYGAYRDKNPIMSKYPIVNKGIVYVSDNKDIRETLFADIKIGKDTIRCYNAHFTSYRYTKDLDKLQKKGPKSIVKRANQVFKYQEIQLKELAKHVKTSPYPVVFCGDFNNMAYSYMYRELKKVGNLKDTFNEAGKGFGATIYFPFFPTRIDFILIDEVIEVLNHKVIKTKDWSDHYPVISEIVL